MANSKVVRHPSAPRSTNKTNRMTIPSGALERSRERRRLDGTRSLRDAFVVPSNLHPINATPKDVKTIAQDEDITQSFAWAQNSIWSAWEEGLIFPGYAELSLLAIRPEYRVIAETLSSEMTREWIILKSTGEEDKTDKIKQLEAAIKQFKVQNILRKAFEQDAFFGRAHIYIGATDNTDDREELLSPIGNGRDAASVVKVRKGGLKRLKNVEPVWCYPTRYNSNDPLKDDWYRPTTWHIMGKEVHSTRLLTIFTREIPDLLKPAYSFGGLSMSQMVKPYVDNWLRTRQSIADLIHAFSVFVLKTNMGISLQQGADEFFRRLDLFTNLRDNRGVMPLDKETEELENVSAPLSTLDQLQAQTQEHMAAICRIPLVKLLGIQPAGLNASSEGEIRVFYDSIAAAQEAHAREILETILGFLQLHIWGEVDPELDFEFKGLWQLDEAGKMAVEKVKADIATAYLTDGIIAPEEERERIGGDPESIYQGLDLDKRPLPQPEMPDFGGGEEEEMMGGGFEKPKDPGNRLATGLTNRAASFGGATTGGFGARDLALDDTLDILDAFEAEEHPRGQPENKGQFVEKGGEVKKGAAAAYRSITGKKSKPQVARKRIVGVKEGVPIASELDKSKWELWSRIRPAVEWNGKTYIGRRGEEHVEVIEKYPELKKDEDEVWLNHSGYYDPIGEKFYSNKILPFESTQLYDEALDDSADYEVAAVKALRKAGYGLEVDQETAEYTDSSTTPQHCVDCTMFEEPDGCTLVKGKINPEGWCRFFEDTTT